MEKKTLAGRVAGRRRVAEGTWEVRFEIDASAPCFEAGQHALVGQARLDHDDPRGPRRVFSVCSSPNERGCVRFAFRDTGSGYKRTLLGCPPGTPVEIGVPRGAFLLPGGPARRLVFVAGGIGITPFLSMLRYAAEARLLHEITLHFVNRNRESAPYLAEIEALAARNPRFTPRLHFDRQALAEALAATEDPAGRLWYIVGPPPMPAELRAALVSRGVAPESVLTEEFVGYGARR